MSRLFHMIQSQSIKSCLIKCTSLSLINRGKYGQNRFKRFVSLVDILKLTVEILSKIEQLFLAVHCTIIYSLLFQRLRSDPNSESDRISHSEDSSKVISLYKNVLKLLYVIIYYACYMRV